jgi:hypothetical protein
MPAHGRGESMSVSQPSVSWPTVEARLPVLTTSGPALGHHPGSGGPPRNLGDVVPLLDPGSVG